MRHAGKIGLLLVGTLAVAAFAAAAQQAGPLEEPLLVNYGKFASGQSGDNDHRQAIYLSVPAATTDKIYVRIFDGDTNNSTSLYDKIDRPATTRTRFTVFGGAGALVTDPSDPEAITEEELNGGTKLAEKTFGRERRYDAKWETIAELDPATGELVGDTRVFRLLVDAISGVNGNVYDVGVSLRADENVAPPGLRMFAYTSTVRMPRRGVITELRFKVPEDADILTLGNFDAAFGTAFYTTQVMSTELAASGQGDMARSSVFVQERDKGETVAVTLSGGTEYPNDATFFVMGVDGRLLPFEFPPKVFELNQRPTAVAASDASGACMTVAFDGNRSSDPEGKALSYLWRFGDGTEADGATATHDYTSEGRFTAQLEVVDHSPQLGNGDTVDVPVFVKNPPVALSDKRVLVAQAEDNLYSGAPSTARAWKIARHEWDFGDGTAPVEGESVTHAYAEPGTYTVTHKVTDDSGHRCNNATEQFEVRVNAKPVAEAGADRRIAIDEETVLDAGASTDSDGTIVDYQWDFGDGNTASGPVVRHAYAKPATYTVRLVIADDSAVANSGHEDTLTVIVNDPPVPEAGADQSGAIDEVLTFNAGQSIDRDGTIIAYDWDFGDGAAAAGAEVSHAYAKSGTYVVTVKTTDDSTTRTAAVEDTLSVRVNEPPIAEAGPDQLVTASLVEFDGSASSDADDEVAVYDWEFGDGNTGSGAKPTHVYAKPGTYDVKLTVTDASKTIRSSAEDRLQVVVNAVPIADAGPDLIGAPGETLVFQASRSLDPDGEIAAYEWDFRDGGTATGKVAEHAFEKAGTYAVRLTVKDDTGHENALDFAETLVFVNNPPVAEAGADVAAVPGDEIKLSAAHSFDSDGELVSYRWDFSDSDQPVEGAEIARVFDKPGVYSAQLTVTDDSGAQNGLATDTVRIAINHAPVADAGPNIVTDQSTIAFDGTKSLDADGDALSYAWDFGDGAKGTGPVVSHTYGAGGTYPVILTVDDGTGLRNATHQTAISVAINRPPVAVAGENRQVCTGDTIILDGSDSKDPEGGVLRYSWYFGDGTTSEIVNPTKSYSIGGTYPITLTVRDDSGLANGTNSSQLAVIVDQGPVARAGEDVDACAGTELEFDGSGSTDVDGVVNSFTWDFGDGGIGGGERPKHIFTKPGTYRVFLRIEGEKVGICDPTSTDELEARIFEGPVAIIKAPDAVPVTDTITFDASASTMSDGNIIDWQWDFGDGTRATGAGATHQYAAAGTYQVSLTLKSDHASPSCQVVSARHVITINAPPAADAGADQAVAVDQEVVFDGSASADPDGGLTAYEWDFGDGATASGIDVRHRYRAPGIYTAKLTVRDDADLGNSAASDEATIMVNPLPAPAIAGPAVACVDETVAWQAANSASEGTSFAWSFGDGATADSGEVTHAYAKPGWYSLLVNADDGKGLANSRQSSLMTVHVNQPPHAAAGPDQMTCAGDTVSFSGSASTDPDGTLKNHLWDFGDGQTAEGADVAHAFAAPGTYKVTLTVTDDAASTCSSTSDSMEVFVNAPPVADAGSDREVFIGGANDAVLLDGSASSDPDGQALSHTWQIGGGQIGAAASTYGERVRHTFTETGEIPVTLTVADTSGLACGTTSSTVRIIAKERN